MLNFPYCTQLKVQPDQQNPNVMSVASTPLVR